MAKFGKIGFVSGKIENMVFRNYNGTIVVCAKPTRYKDAKTEKQVLARMKMRNIQNLYAAVKEAVNGNFQDKTGRQSDYSRFQGVNMHKPAAYLNKQESAMKQQVVAPYTISSGTLLPVSYTLGDDWLETDIKLGNINITDDTSISDLASAILVNNDEWENKDSLELIAVRQTNAYGCKAETFFTHVTLNKNIFTPLNVLLFGNGGMQFELKASDHGCLMMKAEGEGGFAIIRKRETNNKTLVSTQDLAVRNSAFDFYHSDKKKEEGLQSYGVKR